MGKLHELLAVRPSLKTEAQQALSRVIGLLKDGQTRLVGQYSRYEPLAEDGEPFPDEIKNMATTVDAEIGVLSGPFAAWLDALLQIESTNQNATGDLFGTELPATALLALENALGELRGVYAVIPTNDPTERWQWDQTIGCYVSPERIKHKTKKIPQTVVLHPPTPEHPAQTQLFTEDVRIGTWHTVIHSGMLSPEEKRARLGRLDGLIREVRKARERANCEEVVDVHLGEKILAHINKGVDLF